ncbi:Putative carbohydrate kinase PfkB, ribokinase [Septoria linicola]|uniref:Carbohydrate kinase PfkB, ribokinase n=1 Tax=Septoria linicola TaxID=215465 RepID=A0A9Q9AQE9_9PEZI|nr:putative carbohydrate kinase PfkB, ribokinase [Septoria linicola]USW53539.1 Putative carbohydrate kinase PfkB, ribokinase [Septoria linicola]
MSHPTEHASVPIDFCTLGMFIIDDIYPHKDTNQEPKLDVIGGAGTYSAIGARLFSPPPQSRSVGWIVDAGTDFPDEVRSTISSWETGALIRQRPAPTTRGWNGYSGNQHRAFKYLTEKLRLTADDLTPDLAAARSFHLICSPLRAIDQVEGVLSKTNAAGNASSEQANSPYASNSATLPLDQNAPKSGQTRSDSSTTAPRPIFIWEPVPDLCTPEELDNTLEALRHVDVISPNHEELASIFSFTHPDVPSRSAIEDHAQRLLDSGIGPHKQGAVVVRAGAEGCFVLTATQKQWLPAYHTDASRVIDPTGGGNGMLGGLAVGLVRTDFDVVEAARWGSVAASFTIEQVGMPVLTPADCDGEKWNGASVADRLVAYRARTT